jgi:hypothetical protein
MSSSETITTVPEGQVVVSNGKLVSVKRAAAQVTYDWVESIPHSSYLLSLAIGPWKKTSDNYKGKPVDYYAPRGVNDSEVKRLFHLTPDMIGFFSRATGDSFYAVRIQAAISLGAGRSGQAKQALLNAMSQPDSRVRAAAVSAMSNFLGDRALIDTLIRSLHEDPSYAVQAAAAAEELGRSGDDAAFNALRSESESKLQEIVAVGYWMRWLKAGSRRPPTSFFVTLSPAPRESPRTCAVGSAEAQRRIAAIRCAGTGPHGRRCVG